VLIFAHRGFVQADEDYALVTTGWAYYLVSLTKRQKLRTSFDWEAISILELHTTIPL
jgi:hypothetical protein